MEAGYPGSSGEPLGKKLPKSLVDDMDGNLDPNRVYLTDACKRNRRWHFCVGLNSVSGFTL